MRRPRNWGKGRSRAAAKRRERRRDPLAMVEPHMLRTLEKWQREWEHLFLTWPATSYAAYCEQAR